VGDGRRDPSGAEVRGPGRDVFHSQRTPPCEAIWRDKIVAGDVG